MKGSFGWLQQICPQKAAGASVKSRPYTLQGSLEALEGTFTSFKNFPELKKIFLTYFISGCAGPSIAAQGLFSLWRAGAAL